MLFTLPVGTAVKADLQAGGSMIRTAGRVVTRDQIVGNGIEFTNMTVKDRETLVLFIENIVTQQKQKTDHGADRTANGS
jgi:hypothetical protein